MLLCRVVTNSSKQASEERKSDLEAPQQEIDEIELLGSYEVDAIPGNIEMFK